MLIALWSQIFKWPPRFLTDQQTGLATQSIQNSLTRWRNPFWYFVPFSLELFLQVGLILRCINGVWHGMGRDFQTKFQFKISISWFVHLKRLSTWTDNFLETRVYSSRSILWESVSEEKGKIWNGMQVEPKLGERLDWLVFKKKLDLNICTCHICLLSCGARQTGRKL